MNAEEKQEYLNQKALSGKIQMYIPEVFDFIAELKTKEEKMEAIKNNYSPAMGTILRLAYSPDVTFLLTKKEVAAIKYEKMDIPHHSSAPITLFSEHKRLNIFTNERGSNLRKEKLSILLSQMFSSMHDDDIKIIKNMMNRKLGKGITEAFVREVFPELLPAKVSTKEGADE